MKNGGKEKREGRNKQSEKKRSGHWTFSQLVMTEYAKICWCVC